MLVSIANDNDHTTAGDLVLCFRCGRFLCSKDAIIRNEEMLKKGHRIRQGTSMLFRLNGMDEIVCQECYDSPIRISWPKRVRKIHVPVKIDRTDPPLWKPRPIDW